MSTYITIRQFPKLVVILLAVSGSLIAATGVAAKVGKLSPAKTQEIREALSCAASSKASLLGASKRDSTFEVRSLTDTISFPGERHLLLMVGSGMRRTLLDFQISHDGNVYRLTNNADIVTRGARVDFASEPLGGVWAHQYLAGFARKVTRRTPIQLRASSRALVTCEYYYSK